ncbi:hypothetical protein [Kitasatospora sp. NPDC047058]|uniref:hypothetical protein n=1 Tax=Kitasatospora sp. NPDC047058 TaxID=3155620 RepID=UPI0033F04756
MPEELAVFGVRHRGPRAARRVAALRAEYPDAPRSELVRRVVDRARRVSETEGAFIGGPFLWMAPFAFCTALLTQGQLMLELAALAGKDPTAPARTAEILVLQGAYPDLDAAERALAAGPPASGSGSRRRGFFSLIWRMARLLGLTSEDEVPPPSRWRTAAEWLLVGVVLLIGMVVPLVWLPYMGFSYHRATNKLAARAVAFNFGGDPAEWSEEHRARTDPGIVAAAARAVYSLLVPVAAVIVIAVADIRVAGSQWPVLTIALFTLSGVVGVVWYRRHRHRRTG